MSNPMVARVARAIHAKLLTDESGDGWVGEFDPAYPTVLDGSFDLNVIARAAIEAMREPDARMVREGESAASLWIGTPYDDEAIPRLWHWMVDAALKETVDA